MSSVPSPSSYASPNPPGPVQPAPKNGFGIAALVLGIVGLVLGFVPIAGIVISLLLGLIGLVLGVLGINRARKGIATNKVMAIIGTILSVLAILLGIFSLIISVLFVGSLGKAIEESGNDPVSTSSADAQPSGSESAAEAQFPGQLEKDVVGEAGAELTVGDAAITTGPLTKQSGPIGEYYCTDVSVTNNGSETFTGFGSYSFKVQNPSGAATDATYSGIDGELQSSDLAPGGTATGKVCFDTGNVAPGQNVVLYQDLFGLDQARGAWINTVE